MAYWWYYVLFRIEGPDEIRLDICRRIGGVVILPCEAGHVEDT